MKIFQSSIESKISYDDICLIDSATTHTILKDKKYFSHLVMKEANINTICGSARLIEDSRKTNLLLPGETNLMIDEALYCSKSQRNFLGFKDIRQNGYHIETTNDGNIEYLYIPIINSGNKYILEKLPTLSSGLYYTSISTVETHAIVNQSLLIQTVYYLA